ncbi:hypothetical protein AAG906_032555 [Vitis piasezkii]
MGYGRGLPGARIVEIWVIEYKTQLKQLLSLNNQDENSSSKVNATIGLGKQRDGLYYLVALATEKSLTNHSSSTNQPACNLAISSTDLWHKFLNFLFSPIMLALYVLWLSKVVYLLPMPPMFTPLTNLIIVPCHPSSSVFTSRDVKFHEDIFPYVSLKPNSTIPLLTHNFGPIPWWPDISSSLDSTSHALSPLLSNHTSTPSPTTENDDFSSPSRPSELVIEPSSQIDPNPPPSPSATLVSSSPMPPFASISSFVAQHSAVTEPRSYSEAAAHPEWQEAMRFELQALQANGTWSLTPFRPARHRLVSIIVIPFPHYRQDHTCPCLLALAAARGWSLHQMDVNNDFRHGDLHEEIYMSPPPGRGKLGMSVCKLKKSLYGLKQSPRAWFGRFTKSMRAFGYCQRNSYHTLFLKKQHGKITTLIVYVDDMVVTGNDPEERKAL